MNSNPLELLFWFFRDDEVEEFPLAVPRDGSDVLKESYRSEFIDGLGLVDSLRGCQFDVRCSGNIVCLSRAVCGHLFRRSNSAAN